MITRMISSGIAFSLVFFCSCSAFRASTDTPPPKPPQKEAANNARGFMTEGETLYVKALQTRDEKEREKQFKAAIEQLQKEANEGSNLKAHLLLGYMADLGQGMSSDGITAARHYRAAADGGLPEAKAALAEFWLRNGIFLDAAAAQIMSIPDYQKNPAHLCTLGAIYYAQFENQKGFEVLKKAFAAAGRMPQIRVEVMKIIHRAFEAYFKNGNFDAALVELKREQTLDANSSLIPYFMGLVELRRGNAAAAEELFNESLKRNPAVPYPYRELALIKARSGRPDEAVDDIKVAYAVSGKTRQYQQDMIEIYFLTRRYQDLITLTTRILQENPNDTDTRNIRGSIYLMRKEYTKALEDLQKLAANPKLANEPEILEGIALATSYLGRLDEARKAYEKILQAGFQPVTALNLSELYIVQNCFSDALKLLANEGFKQSKDIFVRCISAYLEATALLASGKNADAQIKLYYELLPSYKSSQTDATSWEVELFDTWLKKAALSPEARKIITEMTVKIAEKPQPKMPLPLQKKPAPPLPPPAVPPVNPPVKPAPPVHSNPLATPIPSPAPGKPDAVKPSEADPKTTAAPGSVVKEDSKPEAGTK
ncbi:MAG: photosystem I assembly protein Ycf3 [Lentisphaerae bacterium ADurb.Bin242]|nr:MAG: photosystem I assembly protein Ycf3 [Lentisphaerae bacterium ADurb.Bin242]